MIGDFLNAAVRRIIRFQALQKSQPAKITRVTCEEQRVLRCSPHVLRLNGEGIELDAKEPGVVVLPRPPPTDSDKTWQVELVVADFVGHNRAERGVLHAGG